MNKIQAIETSYAGCRFRSRLEARWAVFFDRLGIQWQYEAEGYVLPDGTCYLPDFWLPGFNKSDGGTFVEVKPGKLTHAEMLKVVMLNEGSGNPVLLAVDVPDTRIYHVVWQGMWEAPEEVAHPGCFQHKYLKSGRNGDEYRMFWYPGFENEDGTIDHDFVDEVVIDAVGAARESRFEFGQSGPRPKAPTSPWRARL